MILKLVTPYAIQEFSILWIEIETPDGSFIIQKEHTPTVFILSAQKQLTYCLKTEEQQTITLQESGILQVFKNKLVVAVQKYT